MTTALFVSVSVAETDMVFVPFRIVGSGYNPQFTKSEEMSMAEKIFMPL
jgi:hypothetical protein